MRFLTSTQNFRINLINAQASQIDINPYISDLAEQLSQVIISQNDNLTTVATVADNNEYGLITLQTLCHLKQQHPHLNCTYYLVTRATNLPELFKSLWQQAKSLNIDLVQDTTSKRIEKHDVIVEALASESSQAGQALSKKVYDICYRLSRLKTKIIAFPSPSGNYQPINTVNINAPTQANNIVISSQWPAMVDSLFGPGEVSLLAAPLERTHIGKRGRLTWIGDFNEQLLDDVHNYAAVAVAPIDKSLDKIIIDTETARWNNVLEQTQVLAIDPNLDISGPLAWVVQGILKEINSAATIVGGTNLMQLLPHNTLSNTKILLLPANLKLPTGDSYSSFAVTNNAFMALTGFKAIGIANDGQRKLAQLPLTQITPELVMLTSALATRNHPWLALTGALHLYAAHPTSSLRWNYLRELINSN